MVGGIVVVVIVSGIATWGAVLPGGHVFAVHRLRDRRRGHRAGGVVGDAVEEVRIDDAERDRGRLAGPERQGRVLQAGVLQAADSADSDSSGSVTNCGFGMFASRIVCACSLSVQPSAAGVLNVLCRISWVAKPGGRRIVQQQVDRVRRGRVALVGDAPSWCR